jgi:hypothetical protein
MALPAEWKQKNVRGFLGYTAEATDTLVVRVQPFAW